jgi:PAS domain S-box-containing protein
VVRTGVGTKILEGQHWLELMWEHTSDAMALSDEAGIVLAVNPAYHRLYGYSPDEVVGHTFALIFPAELRASAEAQYKEVFRSENPPPVVASTVQTRDGFERIVESRVSFVEDTGHRVAMLSVIRDVTDEVAARREADRATSELQAFLFSVSHDIKSPLAIIKGHAQVLRRQIAGSAQPPPLERLADVLRQIEASALRVAGLVDDLVEVASMREGDALPVHTSQVDVVSVVRDSLERHQLLTDRHQFVLDAEPESISGLWDEPRLGRVLDNLVGNAIKYSPDGGLILMRVRFGRRPQEGRDIEPAAGTTHSEVSDGVLLSIEDNGIGIAADDLPRVFDRFHRGANVPDAVVGTGIGLTSVAQIVHQHGGTIGIASQLGAGTRVTVWLPLRESDSGDVRR